MRIAVFILCCILSACQQKHVATTSKPICRPIADSLLSKIKHGDLILRAGRDEVSQLFSKLNTRNRNYSHCGVAFVTDSGCFVYHIIGGLENPQGTIVSEPIDCFVSEANNSRWAIIHYNMDSPTRTLFCKQVEKYALQKVSFDTQFDLKTEHQMYCSELVFKSLVFATKDTAYIPKTISHSGKPYIAIDNLFDNNHSQIICEVIYK